ncbi:MAG: HisA/HisF-related TIM barrel protein [Bacteroidales bacterium]
MVSGGVSSNADILKLEELGLKSVIIGKAIYEDKIDLETLLW